MKWVMKFDRDAYVRHSRSHNRRRWLNALGGYTVHGLGTAACGLVLVGAAMYFNNLYGPAAALLAGIVGGFIVGTLYMLWEEQERRDKVIDRGDEYSLTLEMSDDGFTWTDAEGQCTLIPWRNLSLDYESPDGFTLKQGDRKWWLYRKPMQDAGLEEEFLRRISGAELKTGGE